MYLVGQLIRVDEDLRRIADDPVASLQDPDLESTIDGIVRHVAGALARWHDEQTQENAFDNFKVDFKNEDRLRALATAARGNYLYARALED